MTIQILLFLLGQFLKIWQSKYYWVSSLKYDNPNIIIIIRSVPQNMTIHILLGQFLKIWQSKYYYYYWGSSSKYDNPNIIGTVPQNMAIQILLGQFLKIWHPNIIIIIGAVPQNMTIQILLGQFHKIWQSKYYWDSSSKYGNPNMIGTVPQNMTIQVLYYWSSFNMTIQILLGRSCRLHKYGHAFLNTKWTQDRIKKPTWNISWAPWETFPDPVKSKVMGPMDLGIMSSDIS